MGQYRRWKYVVAIFVVAFLVGGASATAATRSPSPSAVSPAQASPGTARDVAAKAVALLAAAPCTCPTDIKQRDDINKKYFEGASGDIADDIIADRAWTYLAAALSDLLDCHKAAIAAGKKGCALQRVVPYPLMKRNRPNDKKYYFVYEIQYFPRTTGTPKKTWKYGIGQYGSNRRAVSTRKCRNANLPGNDCSGRWKVKKIKGWTNARTIEASLILQYAVVHGKCPPGQLKSCT